MDRPLTIFSVAVFVLGLTLLSMTRLGTAFLPTLEENNIWLRVTLPNTVDLGYSVKIANQLRETFMKQPEIDKVAAQIGRPNDLARIRRGCLTRNTVYTLRVPRICPANLLRKI